MLIFTYRKERYRLFKRLFSLLAGLIFTFLIGFLLAGGRDVLRPETVNRVAEWATESISPTELKKIHDTRREVNENVITRLKRLLFMREAITERVTKTNFVNTEDLPDSLTKAIVAVEDSRFYSHPGFDIESIARSMLVNLQRGEIEEGASTITQQLIKNLFLTQEQSFARKAEEIALATRLEICCPKDEILTLYLNTIYFGSGYYGVRDASLGYFGKEPRELSLPEAAMLAGLPNAPSVYSPYENFLLAKKRQFIVLDAMVRAGIITKDMSENAKIAPIYLAR